MAEIVKACDTSLPSRPLVAVKRILPHLCDDTQYRTMFLDESRVLAQLDHPNIIHAFEIGEVDATPYIALDYVDGQDARALFHRARSAETHLPIAITCYIIASVCDGLHHAHEQVDAEGELLGLVHRDVSLQNVLLSYAGDVKITDFGIAVSKENEARTEVGIVKGKFGYMSPEQIRGAPLDRRSDIFGAGICLYELLTRERLFVGDSDFKAVEKVRNVDIDPPSKLNRNIPSELERVVMKALAKQPRDRYSTALDMRRDLLAFMAGAGERCTRDDLGAYLRELFADEYESPGEDETSVSASPALESARDALRVAARTEGAALDGTTGLAAFDHLEPVSTVNFATEPEPAPYTRAGAPAIPSLRHVRQATLPPPGLQSPPPPQSFRPAPVVPPVVPKPDSIPGTRDASEFLGHNDNAMPEPRPMSMDWDEVEPTTISQGFDTVPKVEPLMPDDEVTRVRTDEPLPSLARAMDDTNITPLPHARLPDWQEETSRPPLSYRSIQPLAGRVGLYPTKLIKVALGVVGVLVLLAALLFITRDRGVATIHLTTEPIDAIVTVDGARLPSNRSPFVLSDLDTRDEHTISVDKPGFQGWSTRLKLRPDQVLSLPVIRLEPDRPPLPGASAARDDAPGLLEPAAATSGRPAAPTSEPTEPAATKATTAPAAQRRSEASRPKRTAEPRAKSRAATGPKAKREPVVRPAPVAASGGTGMLRLNTRPWSRVTIDGKAIGNTPLMAVPLRAGKHTLQLANPEFGINKTLTIEIKAGETLTRVLNLQ